MLLDYRLPDIDGLAVLRELKELDPDVLVILLTSFVNVETAVEAMKLGAYHFANKPFNLDDVACDGRAARSKRHGCGARCGSCAPTRRGPTACTAIVGQFVGDGIAAAAGREGRRQPGLDRAADRRERHRQGPGRQGDPLQQRPRGAAVHEHHLFGAAGAAARERAVRPRARRLHRRAACRSAGCSRAPTAARSSSTRSARWCRRSRPSCCAFSRRRASSASAAPADIHVDVRVVAATNRNLEEEVAEGPVPQRPVLPPERPADAAAAAARSSPRTCRRWSSTYVDTLQHASSRSGSRGVSPAACAAAQDYGWPGNVRELRNVVERAMLLAEGDRLEAEGLRRRCKAGAGTGRPVRAAGGRRRPRGARAQPGRAGARTRRREPDRRPPTCSVSIGTRSATGSRSSGLPVHTRSATRTFSIFDAVRR